MTGSTAPIEPPGRRSDLLPARMMGTLQGEASGHRGWGNQWLPPTWALPVTWNLYWSPHSPVGST